MDTRFPRTNDRRHVPERVEPGLWHLRASILALLVGIGIGLVSVKGCAPVDDDGADGPPLDDTDPHDLAPNGEEDAGVLDAGTADEMPDGDLDDAGAADGDAGVDDAADAGSEEADAGTEEVDAGTEEVDAGSEDTGELGYHSTDRGEFFGDTRCPSFALLCEDFEDGMPASTTWEVRMTSGTVMGVDDGPSDALPRVARGSGALHITLPPEPSEAYLRNESLFPRPDDVIWGRLFFYVASPGPDAFVHWNVVEATGPSQTNAGVTKLVRYGGVAVRDLANAFDFDNWLFNFEQRPRPSGFEELAIREDGQHIDRGTWHCMEWMFDGVTTDARVFRDGVEIDDARGGSPLEGTDFTMPSFDGIHIGFAHYQFLDRGFEVWIDGVALDDERIGCSN